MKTNVNYFIGCCYNLFLNILAVEGEKLLFILRNKVQTYDITWQNRTTVTDYLADIVEIDYDFETQTIFYVIDRKTIYSMNLITKGVKVWSVLFLFCKVFWALKLILSVSY